MLSSYQTFSGKQHNADPASQREKKRQAKPKEQFLALILLLAVVSMLGFAASGAMRESGRAEERNLAMSGAGSLRAHAKNAATVCESWDGGSTLTADNKLPFTVPMADELTISFTLSFSESQLAEEDVEEASLLFIGGSKSQMFPSFWLERDGTSKAKLEILWRDAGEAGTFAEFESDSESFDPEVASVEVRLEIKGKEWLLFFDGEEQEDGELTEGMLPDEPTDFEVYAAAPTGFRDGSTSPAPATISNLQICATNAWIAPTESPTPAPTAVTPAPTVAPECRYYANGDGQPLEASEEPLFSVETTPGTRLSFTLRIDALNSGAELESILHVGSTSDERSPSIYLPPHDEAKLYVAFNPSKTDDTDNKFATVDIEAGKEYEIDVRTHRPDATWAYIHVDGKLAAMVDGGEDALVLLREDVPVYLSPKFFGAGDAPKVVVSDLTICSYECFEAYTGGHGAAEVAQGQVAISDVPLTGALTLSAKITVAEGSPYGNVLQVGDANHNEWPSIFFRPTEDATKGVLVVEFERKDHERFFGTELQVNTEQTYDVKVGIDGERAVIALDGAPVGDPIQILSEFIPQVGSYPVYASAPWNDAASAKVENLKMCNGQPGVACASKLGQTRLFQGNKLFDAYVTRSWDLQFDVMFESSGNGDGNFFYIGDDSTATNDYAPLRLHQYTSHSSHHDNMNVYFRADSSSSTSRTLTDVIDNDNKFHRFVLKVRELTYEVIADGKSFGTWAIDEESDKANSEMRPFYAWAPWSSDSTPPRGLLKDVRFCNAAPVHCARHTEEVATKESAGTLLFEAFVGESWELTLQVKVEESVAGDMLAIGDASGETQPARLAWGTGDDLEVHFLTASQTSTKKYTDKLYDDSQWHEVRLAVRNLWTNVWVDGVSIGAYTMSESAKAPSGTYGVYTDFAGGSTIVGGIKDVKICNIV